MDKFLDFYENICLSQIHHWICVKPQLVLEYELENVITKF